MNKGELYIFIGCIIHLAIWLFVAIGGFFSSKILFLNLLVFLPVIYIVQSMSNHPITKEKIIYILQHKDEFKDPEPFVSYCYNKIDPKEVEHLKKEVGGSDEDIIRALLIIQSYEFSMGIPYIIINIYRKCCDSYRNPMDSQGVIVFAYILNSLALLSKHYKYIFKSITS